MQTEHSHLTLGIDTGGTYTDAAICRESGGHLTLLASAKARTTKENLTIGIRNAVASLNPELLKQIARVSLSTTLATNACVENTGRDVTVVFVDSKHSTETELYTKCGLPAPEQMIFLPGRIDTDGTIEEEPSREEILDALKPVCRPGVCIAISGLFSIRNAVLENKVAEIAKELGATAVCGRDIAPKQLNYIKRAATAMLNGRLQPIISDFLESVGHALEELEIHAPIDIVRSDGSLMSREYALEYPVETLLCGPAASVSGVMNLIAEPENLKASPSVSDKDANSSEIENDPKGNVDISEFQNYLIADIGGTTTDLSLVRNSQAVRTTDGVNIGSYRTCVQSVFVETLGLGGDTRLFVDQKGILSLDQKRAIPMCVLAGTCPEIKQELQERIRSTEELTSKTDYALALWNHIRTYEYRVLSRQPSPEEWCSLSEEEKNLCEYLTKRPRSVSDCIAQTHRDTYLFQTDHLEQMGIVQKAAFTLTDILHLQGAFAAYDAEASRFAAWIFCQYFEMEEKEFCRRGMELAYFRLYRAIVKMCIKMEHPEYRASDESGIERMIEQAFYGGSLIEAGFRLPYPLVGVGAAAHAFVPEVAARLQTAALLPKGSAVANAIGAAACRIRAEAHREILCNIAQSLPYQVCGGDTVVSFKKYDEALKEAKRQAEEEATELARSRGLFGELDIQFQDNHNILDIETSNGNITHDFGGTVVAVAQARQVDL